MVETELHDLLNSIRLRGGESQTTEVKAAHKGCPQRLYDTISAFSNQNNGGTIVFGLDESQGFAKVGVYDAQDLQKKVMEYCEEMTPKVRPVFTVCDEEGMVFVSAEIPPIDLAERPCFRTAMGRLRGAYIRVGEADKPMTEYEVYSYEAFRQKNRDDLRTDERFSFSSLDSALLDDYLARKRAERSNLARLSLEQQHELTGITKNGKVTLSALLLFGLYPQAYYPQLSITATCIPGTEKGEVDAGGNRFTDSKRIEGTLPDMLDEALTFARNNMRMATRIDASTGKRETLPQYPIVALREAILNALVHRDYSFHTEGMPIQLEMYADRLEITNPGGLYGRLTLDQLGEVQPDTRNPSLVTMMETMEKTENRYSGILTIRRAMAERSLPEPRFENARGAFRVTLYHKAESSALSSAKSQRSPVVRNLADPKGLLAYCLVPRTRAEIVAYLAIDSGQYALKRYLEPLIQSGAIELTIPEKPRSSKQQFVTASTAL